ncbi:hypothetical protein ACFVZD_48365 [Streptomyces sp. NPDC058287]|uniref:hypothetical protein n=1 Tax=unclassified Streptomyces TaxID=2593676 RepID=UPI0036E8636D
MTSPMAEPFEPRFMEAGELNDLLTRSQLKERADVKVLMFYTRSLPIGDEVSSTAPDLGKPLGLSTTSASRSIGRLAENGWLQLAYTAVGVKFYRLGPKATGEKPVPEPADDDAPLATVRQLHAV